MKNPELKIEQIKDNDKLLCKLSGWLDPNTSQELVEKVNLEGVKSLVFDMSEIEYIFSSGIRALLIFEKAMNNVGGTIRLINIPEQIKFVFEDTGLDGMLEVKE